MQEGSGSQRGDVKSERDETRSRVGLLRRGQLGGGLSEGGRKGEVGVKRGGQEGSGLGNAANVACRSLSKVY